MSSHESQRMLGRLDAAVRLHLNPDIKMVMIIWNRNKGFIMGFWRWINSSDSLSAVLLKQKIAATENVEERGVFRFYSNDPSPMTFKCKCVQVIIRDCMSGEKFQNGDHNILSLTLPFCSFDLCICPRHCENQHFGRNERTVTHGFPETRSGGEIQDSGYF